MKKVLVVILAVMMMFSVIAYDKGNIAVADSLKDTFVFAMGGQPNILDPAIATDAVSQTAIQAMYSTLFNLDENGAVVPTAVENTAISEDGLTYTLKLADGNKWSDGQPVLASEYAYGAKRSLGMGSALAYYSYFIKDYILGAEKYEGADIADMTDIGIAADDAANTLTFTLTATCPYFTSLLTNTVFSAVRPDFAAEHASTWAESADVPVNGAYYPTKIASNEEIVLKKNPHYVRAANVVTENLILKTMEDMDAQLMAYQNGEIDMASSIDAGVVSSVFSGKPDLIKSNSVINYYVQMNSADWSTAPALMDYNVRRALQLALNREEIVTALDAGEAYYPLFGYVPKGMAGVNGDFREEVDNAGPYVYYDAEEAKALLAKAGYSVDNPLNLVYKYNSNNMHDTVAQVMQQQWKQVGVNVTFEALEIRTFFAERDENGNYQLARGAMSADYMDPTTFLCMLITSAQQKPVVTDEIYDGLIADAETTMDPVERMEKLHKAEKYLVEEKAYTIPVFGYSTFYLLNPAVSGVGYDPVGNIYLENVQVK
jgi:oligopeptide transport system substrate-binding protein